MTSEVRMIPIGEIEVAYRLRDVDGAAVGRLARSMAEVGLVTPIEVLETNQKHYRLIAGAHRLAAAHYLDWEAISAVVFEGDEVTARLREIDENLHRAELTPYDEATFLGMRWHLWEQLHGKTKRGGDRRSIDWRGSNFHVENLKRCAAQRGFYTETAAALGVSESRIRRAVKRRITLASHWDELAAQKEVAKGADLDLLVKLRPRERETAFNRVVCGDPISTVVGEIKAARIKAAPSEDKALNLLRNAWKGASSNVRAVFLNEIGATIKTPKGKA